MKKLSDDKMYEVLELVFRKNPPGSVVGCRKNYNQASQLARIGLIRSLAFGCFSSIEEMREEAERLMKGFELENSGNQQTL